MKIYQFFLIILVTSIMTNISAGECGAKASDKKTDVEYCEEYDNNEKQCLKQDKCLWTPGKKDSCESKRDNNQEDDDFCARYDNDQEDCLEESDRCIWQPK